MKRRNDAVLAAALVLAALALFPSSCSRRQPGPSPAAQQSADDVRARETTVRNVTGTPVAYKIYPSGKPEARETREIAPGAIDRFRTAVPLEIEFNTGLKDAIYSLDPGSP